MGRTGSTARHSLRNRARLRNDASRVPRASRLCGEGLGLCDRAGFRDFAGGGAGLGSCGADGDGMGWLGGTADRDCASGLRWAADGHSTGWLGSTTDCDSASWLRGATNCHCVGWLGWADSNGVVIFGSSDGNRMTG